MVSISSETWLFGIMVATMSNTLLLIGQYTGEMQPMLESVFAVYVAMMALFALDIVLPYAPRFGAAVRRWRA